MNICKIEVELGEYQMDAKQSSADSGTLHKRLVKEKERKKEDLSACSVSP